jgi:hypothetical protein
MIHGQPLRIEKGTRGALPIRVTPILRGKAAEEFEKRRAEAEKTAVPRSDYEQAEKVYKRISENSPLPYGPCRRYPNAGSSGFPKPRK